MTGKWLATILSFALCFSTVACAQPKYAVAGEGSVGAASSQACSAVFNISGHCVFWIWKTPPTARTPGSFTFTLYTKTESGNAPVDFDTAPEVVLWMPTMGHGSSPTTVTRTGVGTYEVTNVFFVMPGDWEIRFQMRNGETILDEAIVSLVR